MIGVDMPDMLVRMERDLGWDLAAAFLLDWAGRDYGIRKIAPRTEVAHEEVNTWLQNEFVHGRIPIPLGPLAWQARLAWAIYNALAEGTSHDRIAKRFGCSVRSVTNHRRRYETRGLLRNSPAQGSPIPRGQTTQGH